MAYTALQSVNALFKRVGVVGGDAGAITSFTDTTKQREIDVALQVWNEVIDEAYSSGEFKGEVDEGSITLVDDSGNTARTEYSLASDFEKFVKPNVLVNAAKGYRLYPYPGGYEQMFADQPDPTDYTGQPHRFVINPDSGNLRPDTHPQSGESGDVYKYLYEKRLNITAITDTFPFSDDAVDAMLSPVADLWRVIINREQREGNYARIAFVRGLKVMNQGQVRKAYGRRAGRPRVRP